MNHPAGRPPPKVGYYIGETSRSFHERMSEHSHNAKRLSQGSHIIKHWMDHHPASREMPSFKYRIRKTFKDCLTRQTTEAVAIMLHQGDLLNGKNDYLTNCITRVKVEEDAYQRKRREHKEEDEKVRLAMLEKFRAEKSSAITGTKRRTTFSIHKGDQSGIKKMRIDGPDPTTPSLTLKQHLSKDPTVLSLEYDALGCAKKPKDVQSFSASILCEGHMYMDIRKGFLKNFNKL